jgi:metal-responsive CopG/Arc/MetJ family transcriptional regulator
MGRKRTNNITMTLRVPEAWLRNLDEWIANNPPADRAKVIRLAVEGFLTREWLKEHEACASKRGKRIKESE